jgi:hypothetical protein
MEKAGWMVPAEQCFGDEPDDDFDQQARQENPCTSPIGIMAVIIAAVCW